MTVHPQTERSVRLGILPKLTDADAVVRSLHDAGFSKEEISLVCSEKAAKDFPEYRRKPPAGTRTPMAAAGGGAIGAVLGGLAAAAVAATGGAGLLIAGPLVAGAGGGGVLGGFIGAMLSRGAERESTDFFDQALREGRVLVAVEAKDKDPARLAKADAILRSAGATPLPVPKG